MTNNEQNHRSLDSASPLPDSSAKEKPSKSTLAQSVVLGVVLLTIAAGFVLNARKALPEPSKEWNGSTHHDAVSYVSRISNIVGKYQGHVIYQTGKGYYPYHQTLKTNLAKVVSTLGSWLQGEKGIGHQYVAFYYRNAVEDQVGHAGNIIWLYAGIEFGVSREDSDAAILSLPEEYRNHIYVEISKALKAPVEGHWIRVEQHTSIRGTMGGRFWRFQKKGDPKQEWDKEVLSHPESRDNAPYARGSQRSPASAF